MIRLFAMKPLPALLLIFALCAVSRADELIPRDSGNLSIRNEVKHAIDKGLAWLETKQDPAGFWTTPEYTAMTALPLSAFMAAPDQSFRDKECVKKGYEYLLSCVQSDGGIYKKNELLNYNTSLSLMALLGADKPEYLPVIKSARSFIVGQQNDLGEKGKQDTPFDGGIGYGDKNPHADLSNTMMGLEALHYSKGLIGDQPGAKDLNWKAAIEFVQRCQNLPEYNHSSWVADDPENKGGFVYDPGASKAGEVKLPSGKSALRSYGSMSYAGLLSYIYADLKQDDPRVKAVFEWLQKNYSLQENPGMGQQGYYYYVHTMAKALAASGVKQLELKDGSKIDWRTDLAKKMIDLQNSEGFWVNENGRFWEKDPVLVTSYSILTLEILYRAL